MLYNSLPCPLVPSHVQDFNRFNSVNWLYCHGNSLFTVETKAFMGVSNTCSMRERIYSDGMMNKQTRVFNFQCFFCVIALPLSGTFQGHKISMGIFWVPPWGADSHSPTPYGCVVFFGKKDASGLYLVVERTSLHVKC